MEFLRVLLGDYVNLEGQASGKIAMGGNLPALGGSSSIGLLELLIRCAADEPERLRSIGETLKSLNLDEFQGIVPANFSAIWSSVSKIAGLAP